MLFLNCIMLFCGLVTIFYYWLTRKYNYWKNQSVPYLIPHFPFGNISDMVLMRKTAGEVYRDIYRNFIGKPAVGFYKLHKPSLLIRDPELVKTVLVGDFYTYADNDFQISKNVDPLLALNPFATNGSEWRKVRQIQLPAQTPNRLKSMIPDMIKCCNQMVDFIKENNKECHEAKYLAGCYCGDTVAVCAFSLESNSFSITAPGFSKVTQGELFGANFWDNISVLCAMLAPSIGTLFKLRILHKEVEDYFLRVINATSMYRIKHGVKHNDFLQLLIDKNQTTKGEKPVYDEVEMAGHCFTFFMDGYETSSILLGFALYELACHPQLQSEIRQEIMAVSKDVNNFDSDVLNNLSQLNNFISETLRLHPPIQALTRICTRDTTLTSGGKEYQIKKGMSVVIPIYALHTDPEYYPEPDTFRPDRFDKENQSEINKYTYLPFGIGPRVCVGIRYVNNQIRLAIISILLNFQINLSEKQKPFKLDPKSTYLHTADGGLWVRFEELNV